MGKKYKIINEMIKKYKIIIDMDDSSSDARASLRIYPSKKTNSIYIHPDKLEILNKIIRDHNNLIDRNKTDIAISKIETIIELH